MKGTKGFGTGGSMDLGTIFDEIFEAAQDFHNEFRRNFNNCDSRQPENHAWIFNENTDYYPNYSYPPMNVYMTADRSLIFEFALAGFDEKDISLSFQGDYMVFQASISRNVSQDDRKLREDETAGSSGYAGGGESADSAEYGASMYSGEFRAEENVRYFKRRLKMKDIEKQKYFVPLDKYAQDKVKAVFRNGILKVSVPPKDEPDQGDSIRIKIVTDD